MMLWTAPEDLDPEFGEAEFDEGDGMLDADAHELLKSVFPQQFQT